MLKAIRFVTAGVVLGLVITAMQSGVFTAENASPILQADGKQIPLAATASLPHDSRTITFAQRGE
jgi:hypothetical protein